MKQSKPHVIKKQYSCILRDQQILDFEEAFEKSNALSKEMFMRSKLLDQPLKTVVVDKIKIDFYMRLTCFYQEFYQIALQYSTLVQSAVCQDELNQNVFIELKNYTSELAVLCESVIDIATEFEKQYPLKPNYYDREYFL